MTNTFSVTYNTPTLRKSPVVFIDTVITAQLATFNITMFLQHCFTQRDDGYVVCDFIDFDSCVTKGDSTVTWGDFRQAIDFIDPMLIDNFIKECDVRGAQLARAEYDSMQRKSSTTDYSEFVSKFREAFQNNLDLSDLTSAAIDSVELSIDYGREINVDLDSREFECTAMTLVVDAFDEAVDEVEAAMNGPQTPAPTDTNDSTKAENNLPVTQ